MTNVAVIYYSSTGNVHALAEAVAEGAEETGAEVRLRRVAEFAPDEAIDANAAWRAHLQATASVPVASLDDLRWADAYAFGSPTRFGNLSAQLKQFRTPPVRCGRPESWPIRSRPASPVRSTHTAATSRRCWPSTTRCTTGERSW
jgi:NAD(P)H dehydrogenase (quinone)